MKSESYLRVDRISKEFPGVQALDQVTFVVREGDIHAVVGENGAGKSTLMKILAGVFPNGSFGGEFLIGSEACVFKNSLEAEAAGIVMIPQELAVVNELSVAENMFLNAWPVSYGMIAWAKLYQRALEMIDKLAIDVDPSTPIKKLGAAKQQLVLVAKALAKNVRILILDEPTSSLSETEQGVLFNRLRKLRDQGITSLYISHKLEEVMAISDKVTVLRDGKHVATRDAAELTREAIVRLMVGRPITQMYPRQIRALGDTAMQIENLTLYHPDLKETKVVNNASFGVKAGEILGLYGLIGAGRTELMHGIFGAWPGRVECTKLEVGGKSADIASPAQAMARGIGLLTEDRKRSGIVEGKDVKTNITVASLRKVSNGPLLDATKERILAERLVQALNVKTPSLETNVENLSGGNQQKVLLARWLGAEAKILLLDEPTRGIDVGAKVEIFRLLNQLAADGVAIVFVSSELPEILGIADRILVMHEGELQASIPWQEATEEMVMHHATGHKQN